LGYGRLVLKTSYEAVAEKDCPNPVPHGAPEWLADNGVAGLVSVIVPTYNRAALLMELLQSLAAQSWHTMEVIVVDDGSTDDTQARLAAWQSSHALTCLKMANGGPAAARNLGLRHARGEFIYFIDSDDLIFPKAIEMMVLALQQSGKPYCLATIQSADINSVPDRLNFEGVPRFDGQCYVLSKWMTHAALYRRTVIMTAGIFDESLRIGEDSEFNWRVVAKNPPCHILPETIGLRRLHNFGHLSIGRTDIELPRHAVDANVRFVKWAFSNDQLNRRTSRQILRNLLVCAVKLGTIGDWQYLDHCQDAALSLTRYDNMAAQTVRQLLHPRFQGYYLALWTAMRIARKVRNFFRFTHSYLLSHKTGQ
jgi:glycosyltransferase involved in cell wall biosynthesis